MEATAPVDATFRARAGLSGKFGESIWRRDWSEENTYELECLLVIVQRER